MIPDFKTFIGESVWNDIRRQSAGTQKRMENNVSNLSPRELWIYIKDNYAFMKHNDISYTANGDWCSLQIPLYNDNTKHADFDDLNTFSSHFLNVYYEKGIGRAALTHILYDVSMTKKLKTKFSLRKYNEDEDVRDATICTIGSPKRMADNDMIIDVINFIIDNQESNYTMYIERR